MQITANLSRKGVGSWRSFAHGANAGQIERSPSMIARTACPFLAVILAERKLSLLGER